MTLDNFEILVNEHDDIMLHCGNFKFTIMTCYDQLLICEQNTEDERFYDTVEDMVDRYKINGKPLREVMKDVVLDSCS